ncbi:MAG: hypothetical protein HFF75_04920 [Oscillospiraceae bacterium]|nr:hypothetical protein [Oscillospiraceae bacterium]
MTLTINRYIFRNDPWSDQMTGVDHSVTWQHNGAVRLGIANGGFQIKIALVICR